MVFEYHLPDVGEGVAEGEIVEWLVAAGDTVEEDQVLAKVETDKALADVPSPVNGTIRELLAEEGEVIEVGSVFVTIDPEGEEPEPAAAEAEPEPEPEPAGDDGASPAAGAGSDGAGEPSTAEGRVFAAPSTRRLARELGVELSAVEGSGPGGRITDHDVRAHAEGGDDGTAAAADAGGETRAAADTVDVEAEPVETTRPPSEAAPADRERTLAAPATRRIAREEGVDIDAVPAVEEREGEAFVTPEAVREYAEAQQRAQAADTTALARREDAGAAREEREPYRGVRKSIGEQMERSKYTAPHVTHHDDVDVSDLVETRGRLKEEAEAEGIHLTYMPFVMKAVVAALKEFPLLNAQLDEENGEIVKKHYYNLGVATATDAGLMVPVLDDVDRKGMLQIASETNELVQKARDRSISIDEMQGGTFTITNVGGIGGEYATPIINYPEVAILALGKIEEKPRVVDGEVVPRHVLPLSLSFDHRVVDGAMAAQFVNEIRRYLKNPELLLLE